MFLQKNTGIKQKAPKSQIWDINGGQESQGYFLFEFETIIGVRNSQTGDFRLMKKVPVEVSENEKTAA